MDEQQLEGLLYRDESETLDFKLGQYPFDGATDDEKSELLKDLLAFANAWRTADAYILAGVQEVRGGRSIVHGVSGHLLNRNLQQFVHSKTNRPLSFSYSGVRFEGRDLGVITIPVQDRPLYLAKDYGQLKANVVYIRRGDSTGIAAPDEVFKMGKAAASPAEPILHWEFANPDTRFRLGTKPQLESQVAVLPVASSIPDYPRSSGSLYGGLVLNPLANRDYFREFAEWVRVTMPLSPLGFVVRNVGTVAAEAVIITLEFGATDVLAFGDGNLPSKPPTDHIARPAQEVHFPNPARVEVQQFADTYEVRAPIGTVQAGTTAFSVSPFYVGARESTLIRARATLAANNLSVPATGEVEIAITSVLRPVSVTDILTFSDPP